ncbi:MAG: hypothetical protein HY525_15595 [Betaproteobacteria bacterium]|nr:hypothetical protein [Betaproteobacteria bacterium]
MRQGIFWFALLANSVAMFAVFNPWFEDWSTSGTMFLVVEAIFLPLIGVPVFIHHLRKGLSPRESLAASLRSVMDFLAGWV